MYHNYDFYNNYPSDSTNNTLKLPTDTIASSSLFILFTNQLIQSPQLLFDLNTLTKDVSHKNRIDALRRSLCGPSQLNSIGSDDFNKQQFIPSNLSLKLCEDEQILLHLQDNDIQKVIQLILNAPNNDSMLLIIRHQLEYNHSFTSFVMLTLSVIEGYLSSVESQDKNK